MSDTDIAADAERIIAEMAAGLRLASQSLAELQALLSVPAESAAEQSAPQRIRDINTEELARIWNSLTNEDSGQRAQIIMARTGWPTATYYRYRTAAIRAGLLRVLP